MGTIASNKLSRTNIERLISPTVFINGTNEEIKNTTSSNDIQLYIELSKRQSTVGRVENVHYKEFIQLLDCNKATFYNSLERLQRLEYIRATADRKGYWTVTILNNIFLTEKDYKKGYMRTNIDFLYSKEFVTMNYVEKRICLYLLLNKNIRGSLEIYIENLARAIGIKVVSVVKSSLKTIKAVFPFKEVAGQLGKLLCFKSSNVSKNEEPETANFVKHNIRRFCKVNKITCSEQDIEEVVLLSGQYSSRIDYSKFINAMLETIFRTPNRNLLPSHVNYRIQWLLNEADIEICTEYSEKILLK